MKGVVIVLGLLATASSLTVSQGSGSHHDTLKKITHKMQHMINVGMATDESAKHANDKFNCDKTDAVAATTKTRDASCPTAEAQQQKHASNQGQGNAAKSEAAVNRGEAKKTEEQIASGIAARAEESKEYNADKADIEDTNASLKNAVKQLKDGLGGKAFIQASTRNVQKIETALGKASLEDSDREIVESFLSTGAGSTGQIIGVLDQMIENNDGSLSEAASNEASAQEKFQQIVSSQRKQVASFKAMADKKQGESADYFSAAIVAKKEAATAKRLCEDANAELADLQDEVAETNAAYANGVKDRAQERVSLQKGLAELSSDETRMLLKKTLSFIQIPKSQDSLVQVQNQFAAVVRKVQDRVSELKNEIKEARKVFDECVADMTSAAKAHTNAKHQEGMAKSAERKYNTAAGNARAQLEEMKADKLERDAAFAKLAKDRATEAAEWNKEKTGLVATNVVLKKVSGIMAAQFSAPSLIQAGNAGQSVLHMLDNIVQEVAQQVSQGNSDEGLKNKFFNKSENAYTAMTEESKAAIGEKQQEAAQGDEASANASADVDSKGTERDAASEHKDSVALRCGAFKVEDVKTKFNQAQRSREESIESLNNAVNVMSGMK